MEIKINPLFKCHANMETQMVKLSALVQTLSFVLDGLDTEGVKAGKSESHAVSFANHYQAYSEMLFLVVSGLQDCKDVLEKLCEKEYELIKVAE